MSLTRPNRSDSLHAQAQTCVAAGLCALPAVRTGQEKRPALREWKPYQSRLPSREELARWFDGSATALCLVCGAVSGNLEMIDFDLGGEAFEPWRRAVESMAPGLVDRLVIESTPSGGRHVIYRCDQPVSGNTKLAQRRIEVGADEPVVVGCKEHKPRRDAGGAWVITITMIETRGEGGLFLCAPSDGYEILKGELAAPPVITSDQRDILLGCAWALDETRPPVIDTPSGVSDDVSTSRPGDEFNRRGDPRAILRAHGWTLVQGGENEHWCRPGKSAGTSATLKDGVFYVFSTNAAPFEAQQGYSPFAVYALLEHGGDFNAAASALASQGYGTAPTRTRGVDLSAFLADIPPAPDNPLAPAPLSVEQLVSAHPLLRPPVVHGLLRQGETMNVIASPKVGKSWLTLDLAIAVATGRPWLGRYATERGDVLIIDNELHRETSAHRIPKVAHARGIPMREFNRRIFVDNLRGRLRDIFTLAPYFAAIEPGRYKVIVLDAFYRFMPAGGDENDNGTMANIYNCIDAFADRLGCSFVLIHHSSKGNQTGKSVTDVGAGAGAQSRATDTHLVLRPHEEEHVVVLEAAVRSWPPIDPLCLRWDFPVWTADEGLDSSQLLSQGGRGRNDPGKKNEWTPESFVEAFVDDDPATRSAIIGRAVRDGLSKWAADSLLRMADADGLLARNGDGKRNDPFTYQRRAKAPSTPEDRP
ncbi:MAG: AAA family ATPase [Phycisphaerales bacterium]|nr:AAA family ATPase [Phycisphaerales bacterium]